MNLSENNIANDLNESEGQLMTICNAAPDAIVVINAEDQIIKWNPKAEQLFGWSADEILNKKLIETIIPVPYREAHTIGLKNFVKTGIDSVLNHTIEMPGLKKNGEEIQLELTISHTLINNNYLFIGFLRDITKRKKAEAEMAQKTEELKRSNAELEQFAYVASHDLQEPLRMIISYLQLIERDYKDKLSKDANDYIEFAVNGGKRMRELILGLLEYSRIGKIETAFEQVDLNLVLKDVLSNLSSNIKENNAQINYEVLPTIYANKPQMQQLFQNIISNAIKFKKDSRPEITISWSRTENEYTFSVADNGIGIDSKYKDKIFLIFQRLNTRETYPGAGIGLAICKKIVELHKGHIWFDSILGQGTTFHFTLNS